MRIWCSGNIPASQAVVAGSTPVVRSIFQKQPVVRQAFLFFGIIQLILILSFTHKKEAVKKLMHFFTAP